MDKDRNVAVRRLVCQKCFSLISCSCNYIIECLSNIFCPKTIDCLYKASTMHLTTLFLLRSKSLLLLTMETFLIL